MKQRRITVFDVAKTRAKYSFDAPEEQTEFDLLPGEGWLEGEVNPDTHYIDPETLEILPCEPFAVEVEDNRISNIPAGAFAHIRGEKIEIDDGELVFEPDMGLPEDVPVTIIHPAYETKEVIVPCRALN